MVALLVGIILILFAVFSLIDVSGVGLAWWPQFIEVLKGGVPIIAVLIGIISVFIGIADIKDRIEAKKEEEEDKSKEEPSE